MENQSAELVGLQNARRLPWIVAAEFVNSIFCALTVFGSVFVLFLSELNLDKTRIGFLISLIPFGGLLAPLVIRRVARFGFKRSFVLFWGVRKVMVTFLLLTPVILGRWGTNAAFYWVAGTIALFALARAVAETGYYPWWQEMVPNTIRGKFSAVTHIVATLGQLGAIAVGGYLMDRSTGLGRFMVLMAAGVVFGFLGVWLYALGPNPKPLAQETPATAQGDEMRACLRDRNFILALVGMSLVSLGYYALSSFLPLYNREQVGLSAGFVVWLGMGGSMGALLSSYLWGSAADRFSSKPILLCSLSLITLLPVAWFLLPRHHAWSGALAMAISSLGGIANMGWNIAWMRYLFVTAVPNEKKSGYLAVYYAWHGLILGGGPLLAGWALDRFSGLTGRWGWFTLTPYAPLFAASVILLFLAGVLLSRVRDDAAAPVRTLVGSLLRKRRVAEPKALKS